jgi:hypothetical protein
MEETMAIARLALYASELVTEPAFESKRSYRRIAGVVDEHFPSLEVLMYEVVPMDLAQCFRHADGDGQEAIQVERLPLVPLKNLIRGLTRPGPQVRGSYALGDE